MKVYCHCDEPDNEYGRLKPLLSYDSHVRAKGSGHPINSITGRPGLPERV